LTFLKKHAIICIDIEPKKWRENHEQQRHELERVETRPGQNRAETEELDLPPLLPAQQVRRKPMHHAKKMLVVQVVLADSTPKPGTKQAAEEWNRASLKYPIDLSLLPEFGDKLTDVPGSYVVSRIISYQGGTVTLLLSEHSPRTMPIE